MGGGLGFPLLTCAGSVSAAAIGTCRKVRALRLRASLPIRQGRRVGTAWRPEHVAWGAHTPHPGKLRPGTGRGPPGSAARASDLRLHVLAARTSSLPAPRVSRPFRKTGPEQALSGRHRRAPTPAAK